MAKILERGDIYFLYRPRVEEEDPEGRKDVQRLYMMLEPHGSHATRRIVVGEKRLPQLRDGGRKNWGFVDEVTTSRPKASQGLAPEEYETKTRGTREQPGARPAGEGVYAIASHDDHTHLAYALELPDEPGEVQDELNIEEEASFILSIKNPEKPSPKGLGLSEPANLPKSLQQRFRGRRFIPAEPAFLDHEGTEILLIGAAEDVSEELGIDLDPQQEDEQRSELLRHLRLPRDEHPRGPLLKGKWE